VVRMTMETEWLERVLAWRASGVTAAEFCEGAAFDASSLRTGRADLGVRVRFLGRRSDAGRGKLRLRRVSDSRAS
jgi:hypothetical protein